MPVQNNNIILIGMPACGKSTVGVLLAKELGFRFIDSDLVIQEKEGRRLHEIIAEEKNEGFLRIEEAVNLTLGNDGIPTVIATGGSAVYSEKAMKHFQSVGVVVYLRLPCETVKQRLGNFSHRGVVMPESYTLEMLYEERCALCEKYAAITVDEDPDREISSVVTPLCRAVEAYFHS